MICLCDSGFVFQRSRQLELEDKQSMLEMELRRYMEMDGGKLKIILFIISLYSLYVIFI